MIKGKIPKWSKEFVEKSINSLPQICDSIELDYDKEDNNSCIDILFQDEKNYERFEKTKTRINKLQSTDKLYRFLIVDDMNDFVKQIKKYGKSKHHETKQWVGLGEAWSTNDDFNPEDLVTQMPTDKNSIVIIGHNPSHINTNQTLYRSLAWTGDIQDEIVLKRKKDSKIHVDKICKYFDRDECIIIDKDIII